MYGKKIIVRRERIDRIPIRLDRKLVRDSRGFARIWGKVVHANALLTYGRGDGYDSDEHVEFVPESTVNDPEAIKSLLFSPITMPHPPEMLDGRNTARHQIGTVIDVQFKDGELRALHQFTDSTALDRIDGGMVELSPGYTAEIDETPGTFEGQSYAASQHGRIYNHNAVIPEARAGHDNKLFIDASRAASGLRIQVRNDRGKGTTMATVTVNDEEFEVPDAVAAELQLLRDNTDQEEEEEEQEQEEETPSRDAGDDDEEMDVKDGDGKPQAASSTPGTPESLSTTTVSVTSGKSATDGLSAILSKLSGLEDRVVTKIDAREKSRQDAEAKAKLDAKSAYDEAKHVLPKSYKWEGKSATHIMRDAIVTQNPDLKAKAQGALKKPGRLRGMFDSEMARKPHTDSHALGDTVPSTGDQDLWRVRVDAARTANRRHKVLGNEAMRHESVLAAGAN